MNQVLNHFYHLGRQKTRKINKTRQRNAITPKKTTKSGIGCTPNTPRV
jgi:hypothetical protein